MQGEERSEMAEGGATGVGELEGMLENLRALSGEGTTAAALSGGGEGREVGEGGATGVGELEGMLENLRALSGEVTTAAVLSEDGELRASTLPPGVDRERYAAMLAALAGIARRTARE